MTIYINLKCFEFITPKIWTYFIFVNNKINHRNDI